MQTADELLSEVDADDQVIGPCRRGDAHRLGLRHRSVHILVLNAFGDAFLQKRALSKDINPGLWDSSAAGHVEFGETYTDCAQRELKEELNIVSSNKLEFLFKLNATEETGWEFVQVFRLFWELPIEPNPDEISLGAWFSSIELEGWMQARPDELTSSFRCIWKRYQEIAD